MLNKIKNRKQEGFTIIEVLIVLAIAGLILLIVFLAVPALQRNSRNTTKKNDVSKALGSVNEYVSNNNGKLPADGLSTDPPATPTPSATDTLVANAGVSTGVIFRVVTTTPTTAARDEIQIVKGVECNNTNVTTGDTAAMTAAYPLMVRAASSRAYVALYVIESTGGKFTSQCQGS